MEILKKILCLSLLFVLASCSLFKPAPLPDTSFLMFNGKLEPKPERIDFQGIYLPDQERYHQLTKVNNKIYVARIEDDDIEDQYLAEELSHKNFVEKEQELREISEYFRERLRLAFQEYPDRKINYAEKAVEKTFILKVAVVELKPTNRVINFLGTVAGFFVPGGGTFRFFASGSVAIEGKIVDAESGDVLMEFKDRKKDKNSPFTIRDYQSYAHARASIDDWADELAELINTDCDHKVEQ